MRPLHVYRALKAAGLGALLFLIAAMPARAADCDRACLSGFLTSYLNALVTRNPSALPLAPNVRFTEDSKDLMLGEGLWKTATKLGTYRQDFLDVRQGVAATFAIVEESGSPALTTVRLKVANGRITEIETLVTHNQTEGRLFAADALKTASPAMNVTPPAAQRASREEAIRLAMYYPRGLIVGSFVTVDAPFAPGAYRIENGVAAAGGACTREGCKDIKAQRIIAHPDLKSSVAAVDEEQGLVLLWMNFGNTNSYGPGNALVLFEAFKVYGGQIHAVEAFMKVLPEATQRGWN